MSTDDPLKNWQLEDRPQDTEQWKLEDAEQDLSKHMQLQPGEPNAYWQPVEYERSPQPRRRNWVLPSVLIVALLAVLGYVGWIALGQLGGGGSLDLAGLIPGMAAAPTPTPTEDAAAVVAAASTTEPTPTVEPTPTSPPVDTPTPTVEPTPAIAMAQLISGTVNAVGGVNARREPAITGEVLQLLDEGTSVVVAREDGDWLQVILPDGVTIAWVAAEFVDRATQPITLAELAALYTQAGLPAPTPIAPAAMAEAITGSVTAPITGTGEITGLIAAPTLTTTAPSAGPPLLVTSGVIPAAPFTNTLPLIGPALTVTDTTGVNARSAPSTDGAIIVTVPNGAVLPVTGRNVAGDWLQVRLPDGVTAWMFAAAVVASADAAAAPVADAATGTQTTTTPATTPPLQGAPTGATATVINELGANLRSAPSRDLDGVFFADQGQSFAVVGRSGDGEWVQVVLPDGSLAWALLPTVELSVGAETLPVTQP
jgi:uncharacterized protein YgiM (DUF1202 family)